MPGTLPHWLRRNCLLKDALEGMVNREKVRDKRRYKIIDNTMIVVLRAGSDGSMSASGSAGPGFGPRRGVNFHLKIFNLGARRGGDVHFQIAILYITVLD